MRIEVAEVLPDKYLIERIEGLEEKHLFSYFDENRIIYLLKDNDKTVGFIAVSLEIDECEIDYIAISKDYEGRGIASSFLKDVFDILLRKGIKTVLLEVRESNFRAIRLYENLGFNRYWVRKKYYGSENAFCYRKELVP